MKETKICRHCGTENPPYNKYCSECGQPLGVRWPFGFGFTLKLIIGVVMWIAFLFSGADVGFLGALMALPLSIIIVFAMCFFISAINGN